MWLRPKLSTAMLLNARIQQYGIPALGRSNIVKVVGCWVRSLEKLRPPSWKVHRICPIVPYSYLAVLKTILNFVLGPPPPGGITGGGGRGSGWNLFKEICNELLASGTHEGV